MPSSVLQRRLSLIVDVLFDGNLLRAAEDTGVKQPTLFKIANGQIENPRRRTLEMIAGAFGVSVDWLFGQEEERQRGIPPWYTLILGYNRKLQRRNRELIASAEGTDNNTRRFIREMRSFHLLGDLPTETKVPDTTELFRAGVREKTQWRALRALGEAETNIIELAVGRLKEMA